MQIAATKMGVYMQSFSFQNSWLAPLILTTMVASVHAGDISPLVLPSQQPGYNWQPPRRISDKREQYYSDFKRDMMAKTLPQRNALATEFRKKLDASSTAAERAHYQRLLNILSEIKN